jgi:hypothetical protein
MSSIVVKGVVRAGRVELNEPINLPDGTEVTITGSPRDTSTGLADENRPPTPEEIAATLAAMDAIEPLKLSDEEWTAWEAERQARKAWEKDHFEHHADTLRRMWE